MLLKNKWSLTDCVRMRGGLCGDWGLRVCVCDWPMSQLWFGLQIPMHHADLWESSESRRGRVECLRWTPFVGTDERCSDQGCHWVREGNEGRGKYKLGENYIRSERTSTSPCNRWGRDAAERTSRCLRTGRRTTEQETTRWYFRAEKGTWWNFKDRHHSFWTIYF